MIDDQGDSKSTANANDAPPNSNNIQADTDTSSISNSTDSSDVTSLLMGDYPDARYDFSAALIALNQTWRLYHRLIIVI